MILCQQPDARPSPTLLSSHAPGIVYNVSGGSSLTLNEVHTISEIVTELADPSCNIIFGAVINDEACGDEVHVTIIATGFSQVCLACEKGAAAVEHIQRACNSMLHISP